MLKIRAEAFIVGLFNLTETASDVKMYIMTLLKQNGTIPSLSAPSIFHSESYNFAHENHNCPFCSPAYFLVCIVRDRLWTDVS